MPISKPVLLLILDGWGYSPNLKGNAIAQANTPTWDHLMRHYPHTFISGCGEDVGLPEGQMGNSEVGHLTLGAGRVIYQDLSRISKAIQNGNFFENTTLKTLFHKAKETQKRVHILGLLSPGGVHSHEDHLFACLKMAQQNGCEQIYLHAFLDGRDTPPQSAKSSLEKCDAILKQMKGAHLATVTGRYYAMDRDKRWERVKLAYDAIVHGQADYEAKNGCEALENAYQRKETDEFVKPTLIVQPNNKPIIIEENDLIIYMNFRSDRARALTYALTSSNFEGFSRQKIFSSDNFVSLTEYDNTLKVHVAFKPQHHFNVLGEYLQNCHLTQLHLAETEKYAHVTFFFNGGVEAPFKGEERILIPSPKVATYDLLPQMSAPLLTQTLIDSIYTQHFDFIVCNYANADMVGHTGNFDATLLAIETLDECLAKITQAMQKVGGEMLITSDHGNAECMLDPHNNQVHTAHTTSLVPLVYFGNQKIKFITEGKLSDIAPTLLHLMQIKIPPEMTGQSLIQELK